MELIDKLLADEILMGKGRSNFYPSPGQSGDLLGAGEDKDLHADFYASYKRLKPLIRSNKVRVWCFRFQNYRLSMKLAGLLDRLLRAMHLLKELKADLDTDKSFSESNRMEFRILVNQLSRKCAELDQDIKYEFMSQDKKSRKDFFADIGTMLALRHSACLLILLEKDFLGTSKLVQELQDKHTWLKTNHASCPISISRRHSPLNILFPL